MSTPLGSSQFFIDPFVEEGQSLRFEDGDSAYLSRTPASAGNRKTWTWSAWVKRGNLDTAQNLFSAVSGSAVTRIQLSTTNQISYTEYNGSAFTGNIGTTAVLRDASAWYHIVVAFDTTEASSADRVKIYVNGTLQSVATTVSISLNQDSYINLNTLHKIGNDARSGVNLFYDGYLANVCFIDGTALDPTSFGEYKNTLWKPKDVSGLTFGTNGFFLDFSDSSAIGDDTSGNSNDFTVSNLVATDVVLDSPVTGGNFCVLDPNYTYNNGAGLNNGNLVQYDTTINWTSAAGTFSVSSGKWYYETKVDNFNNSSIYSMVGLAEIGLGNVVNNAGYYSGLTATSYGLLSTGNIYNNNTLTAYASALSNGDIVGVALDLDAGTLTYYINNVSQGTAFSGLSGEFFPVSGGYSGSINYLNFGQDSSFVGTETPQGNTDDNGQGDFYYAPPSGFLALKTSNLPTPTITAPDEYFNTVLYSGNNDTGSQAITGIGFQPDWLWLKSRNAITNHILVDSVRGTGTGMMGALFSNLTDAEETTTNSTHSTYGIVSSLDSDGFTVDAGDTNSGGTNFTGRTYAAWNWLAGGTSALNQQGTIDSQVSANTDAGFSIVSFTSPATSSTAFTIGHGLSSAPEMIITKERDGTLGWLVYHDELPSPKDNYLLLNSTAGNSGTVADCWGTSAPTSSVFGMKTDVSINTSKSTIAYCFHSVEGYSKVGSYTGNGSADGTFVHCGFRPAFVLIKRTDAAGDWYIYDTKRDEYNDGSGTVLFLQSSSDEYTSSSLTGFDELSNGFKLRTNWSTQNASGGTYIFLALAEAPFKLANAR